MNAEFPALPHDEISQVPDVLSRQLISGPTNSASKRNRLRTGGYPGVEAIRPLRLQVT